MSKRVVILTRNPGIADIPLLRYMQKLDEESVYRLTNDHERFEFVVQLVNDLHNANGFKEHTTNNMEGLTPSTFYKKLCHDDPAIPTFYLAILSEGRFSKITRVTSRALYEMMRDDTRWDLKEGIPHC